MEPFKMRSATPADAERVLAVLEDGKRSIARFGIPQWQHGYPNIDVVNRDIAEGACHVAVDETGTVLGALSLCLGVDQDYVGADLAWLTENPTDAPVPYATIHRCATAEAALKRGVMAFMFAEAEAAAREAGRLSMRIDTHPGNIAMRSFLDKTGFTELGPFEITAKGAEETDVVRIAYEKLL